MNFGEICTFLKEHYYTEVYDRENYDRYLKDHNFSYIVPSIHITGTNGKGSTVEFLNKIYQEKGLKVGTYTSPYFFSPTESIKINDKEISEDDFSSIFNELINDAVRYNLTSFEIITLIMFTYFTRQQIDLGIIEVGLGGYTDATNVFVPLLSIITNVTLEHTQFLGKSISEIADNKGGIIKKNKPVLIGKMDESAVYAIKQIAKDLDSKLCVVGDYHHESYEDNGLTFDYFPYHELYIPTEANYELSNASLAIEATKILINIYAVSEDEIKSGLRKFTMPLRFEKIGNFIIDGAHNADGIEKLCLSLELDDIDHVLFATFRDKNLDTMLNHLGKISEDIVLTTFDNKRARTEEEFFLYSFDHRFSDDWKREINNFKTEMPNETVLVTGSLAFVSLVRRYLYENK